MQPELRQRICTLLEQFALAKKLNLQSEQQSIVKVLIDDVLPEVLNQER